MGTATLTSKKTKWVIDPEHSELGFTVRHMMIANVKGEFRKFKANVTTTGDDPSTANVHTEIDAGSIFTNNEKRDKHLQSEDFFDVEAHEKITFESKSMKKKDEDQYEMIGMLTMKGISKQIKIDIEFGGINKDPWGNQRAGFTIKGKINRKDWGLNWNEVLETGGVLVGDEVKIHGEVQFIREKK